MYYSFLADALVILHLAFVAFVVLGQLAILVGIIFKKTWARAFIFRVIHLVCIGIVATEGMLDIECPLTVWERNLRSDAGQQDVSEAPFIPQLANRILFYPGIPGSINLPSLAPEASKKIERILELTTGKPLFFEIRDVIISSDCLVLT